MLWRGARRRCAWCGGRGAFFDGWFKMGADCRTCGLSRDRGYEGFELGAMAVNIIVVFAALIVSAGVAVVLTVPDIPVLPLVLGLGAAAIVLPIVLYPMSFTLWQAIDLVTHPPDPREPGVPPPRP
jgi:uncharacterized protein (DUF983 family)